MTVCGIQHADGVCAMGKCPYVKMCCPAVWDKSKPQEQTNEEWFCQLPTGEKAAVLDLKFNSANVCRLPTYDEIVEWLKQPHKKE